MSHKKVFRVLLNENIFRLSAPPAQARQLFEEEEALAGLTHCSLVNRPIKCFTGPGVVEHCVRGRE